MSTSTATSRRSWLGAILDGLDRPLGAIGATARLVAVHAAGLARLAVAVFASLARGKVSFRQFLRQCTDIGVGSIPLVMVTAALSGIVTTQQSGYQFTGAVPLYVLGSVVTSSIVLELGPVLTAFVIIGRVGARITAEIGTMGATEQIDALRSLGRSPIPTLGAPRVLAGMLAVPVLVALADIAGIGAGMLAARSTIGLGPESFLYGARRYWHSWDMFYSILKGLTFGFWIPLIGVYMGLRAKGGAQGVGRATNNAVVFMTMLILVVDALFPPLLLS